MGAVALTEAAAAASGGGVPLLGSPRPPGAGSVLSVSQRSTEAKGYDLASRWRVEKYIACPKV